MEEVQYVTYNTATGDHVGRVYRAVQDGTLNDAVVLFAAPDESIQHAGLCRLSAEHYVHLRDHVSTGVDRVLTYRVYRRDTTPSTEEAYMDQVYITDEMLAFTGLSRGPKGLI